MSGARRLLIVGLAGAASACAASTRSHAPPVGVDAPPTVESVAPRGETPSTRADDVTSTARAALIDGCASCHLGGTATAKPAALAVFDLREDDLGATMTDRQLRNLSFRLTQFGETRDDRVAAVRRFIEAEVARRAR